MSCASRFSFQFSSGTGKSLHWEEYIHSPGGRRVPRAASAGFIRQTDSQGTGIELSQESQHSHHKPILSSDFENMLFLHRRNMRYLQSCLSQEPTATIAKGWLSFSYFSMVTAEHSSAQLKRAGELNENASWWSVELQALSLAWLRKEISGTRCCAYHLVARDTTF